MTAPLGPRNPGLAVVDASLVVEALTGNLRARAELGARDLFAPHLLDIEVLHVLRSHTSRGVLPPKAGGPMIAALRELGITRYPAYGLTDRIWELRDNLTAYDASYVAVAEALECVLLTTDARLARAPGVRCPVEVIPDA